jgi:hypothetical protein
VKTRSGVSQELRNWLRVARLTFEKIALNFVAEEFGSFSTESAESGRSEAIV